MTSPAAAARAAARPGRAACLLNASRRVCMRATLQRFLRANIVALLEAAMTYYGAQELAAAFRTVRDNTIKIAEDIPENQYDYRPAPETRSVREMLAHIGASTMFQSIVHGTGVSDMMTLNFQELFQKFTAEETKPRSKAEAIAYLKEEGG